MKVRAEFQLPPAASKFYPDLAARLRVVKRLPSVTIGFDGFVDEMISVVGERQSLTAFSAVPDIATFGGLISKAAGHSSLREIVVNAVHPGGCAVNTGDGLAALGVPVDMFATLGQPMHPAFQEAAARFRNCHSWGKEPGRTLAYEFNDGKLMFSAVSQLADFTPDHVETMLADKAYAWSCATARVIALTDWTLYPHMTAVWGLLQDKVYSKLNQRPAFFIDLVDPSSRSACDIRAMLDTLPQFEQYGPLTLGLNGNEANILARLLDISEASDDPEASLAQGQALRKRLGISEVVIHHIKCAAVGNACEPAFLRGPYCEKPRKSTGAGDRFNAGYCLGLLLQLNARSRLACATAGSGFFVRHARSATLPELADFVQTMTNE
ncbi:MAG: carbohydrate kinase [Verrucomicrobia bacterium]|jgi:sugar/nucleoside kinase (ribokinase family)|nr:carbohydrate kinase [Verrucomicrobiota bacterium]